MADLRARIAQRRPRSHPLLAESQLTLAVIVCLPLPRRDAWLLGGHLPLKVNAEISADRRGVVNTHLWVDTCLALALNTNLTTNALLNRRVTLKRNRGR
jgi:hypothetical protein